MQKQILLCAPLKLDAFQRSIMPLAVGGLVLFGCFWLAFVLSMAWENEKMLREGVVHVAEVYEENPPFTTSTGEVIRFLKARHANRAGKFISFDIPKGIERAPGVQFDVLQHHDRYALPDHARQQQWMGWFMALVGLVPFFIAYHSIKTARLENKRIARLTQQNHRLPAQSFRISSGQEKRAGSMSTVFRVHVKFEHSGKHYEATSESYAKDPSAAVTLERLRVLLDRADPLQSLIAQDTLPSLRELIRANSPKSR